MPATSRSTGRSTRCSPTPCCTGSSRPRRPSRAWGGLAPGGRFVAEFGGRGNVAAIVSAADAASRAIGLGAWENPWYFPSIGEYAPLLEGAGLEVAQAALFDRPTPLEGDDGLRNWVAMFARDLVGRVPPDDREAFFRRVEDAARASLHRDGTWFADYRRLRVVARRAPLEGLEARG